MSAHHLLSNTLIWQMPAVTITISGLLIAATFAYDVPDIARALVTGAGSLFVFAMTLAVERYRMLQLRRRRDMAEIEQRLAPLGARPIAWAAPQVVEQIRAEEFRVRGLYLYRLDGFNVLRALLYGTTALLFVLPSWRPWTRSAWTSCRSGGRLLRVVPGALAPPRPALAAPRRRAFQVTDA